MVRFFLNIEIILLAYRPSSDQLTHSPLSGCYCTHTPLQRSSNEPGISQGAPLRVGTSHRPSSTPRSGVATKLRWCPTDKRCGHAVNTEHLMFHTNQSHQTVNTNHTPKRCNVCSGLPRRAFWSCPALQITCLYHCKLCHASAALLCCPALNPLEEQNGDLCKSRLENALKKQVAPSSPKTFGSIW